MEDLNNVPIYAEELICKGAPDVKTSKFPIKYTKSSFEVNSFHTKMDTTNLSFHVLKMDKSIFLWIGKYNQPTFQDLSLAIQHNQEHSTMSSKILGSPMNSTSLNLANRLSKKLNKPLYVSCNIELDLLSLPFIEKSVCEEIKQKQEVF